MDPKAFMIQDCFVAVAEIKFVKISDHFIWQPYQSKVKTTEGGI